MTKAAPNTKHSNPYEAPPLIVAKAMPREGEAGARSRPIPRMNGPFFCKGAQSLSYLLCLAAFFWYKARPDLHSLA